MSFTTTSVSALSLLQQSCDWKVMCSPDNTCSVMTSAAVSRLRCDVTNDVTSLVMWRSVSVGCEGRPGTETQTTVSWPDTDWTVDSSLAHDNNYSLNNSEYIQFIRLNNQHYSTSRIHHSIVGNRQLIENLATEDIVEVQQMNLKTST